MDPFTFVAGMTDTINAAAAPSGYDPEPNKLNIADYLGLDKSTKQKKSTDALGAAFNTNTAKGQFDEGMHYAKNATQYRVADALKAGINPLAALGVSANYSPTVSSFGESGRRERANPMAGFMRNMMDIAARSAELDLESKRIANETARTELNHLKQPGIPNNTDNQVQPFGTENLLFKPVYDMHGRPRLMVNQDATENDNDNAGYRSAIAAAIANGQIDRLTGRVKSRQVRMMLDDMYYRASGKHITNLEDIYISPTEIAMVLADEAKGWLK